MKSQQDSCDEQGVEWLRCAIGLESGQTPFPWQVDLLQRFLRGDVVSALDVPTSKESTSVCQKRIQAFKHADVRDDGDEK